MPEDQQTAPTPQPVSMADFASKVREKYPEYKGVPDETLVTHVVSKYPQYGNQIKGYAQKRSGDHQGAIVLPPGSVAPAQRTATDKTADFITRNAPTIGGAVGGVAGAIGGLPGSAAGAAAGGAIGSAIKQKAQTGAVSGKEIGKDAAVQGALDLGGGLAGKGILKAAKTLGIDDAIMKFALKRGEDFERDLNPAALMNKYHLRSTTIKDLYQQTSQKIGSLSKTADAMLDEVAPYSSTIRPYAAVKGVIDRYTAQANKVGDPKIAEAMKDMLDGVGKEFNNVSTGAAGQARQAAVKSAQSQGLSAAGTENAVANAYKNTAAKNLPTDRLLTPKEANQLKQVWGDSVQWGKEPPQDSMQAAFKTVQNARRDIYHALNESISDAMGGNQGKLWKSTNHDIFNLMEAKGALQEAEMRTASDAKGILPAVLDMMRHPGIASDLSAGYRNAAVNATKPGVIPNMVRAGSLAGDAMSPDKNPIPLTQK